MYVYLSYIYRYVFTTLFIDSFLLPCNRSLVTDFGLGSVHPIQASIWGAEVRNMCAYVSLMVSGKEGLIRIADLSVPLYPPQSVLRKLEVFLTAWVPQQEPQLGSKNHLGSKNIYIE